MTNTNTMKTINIGRVLVVMMGGSGSGKSTFTTNFDPREVVSTDALRDELLGDFHRQDEGDVVFAEFYNRLRTRLRLGNRAVADATNLTKKSREALVALATEENADVVYVLVDRPLAEKVATGGWRNKVRIKGRTLVEVHHERFQSSVASMLLGDGHRSVMVVDTRVGGDDFEIIHPLPRRADKVLDHLLLTGFNHVRVVGDVHGNMDGLERALDTTDDTFFVFLGDVVDYGEKSLETSDVVLGMVKQGRAIMVRGNHERKITNFVKAEHSGEKFRGVLSHGNDVTVDAMGLLSTEERKRWGQRFLELVALSPDHLQIGNEWMFVHAAVDKYMWDNPVFRLPKNSKLESMALFGQTTGEYDENGFPVRKNDWVDELLDGQVAMVGHAIHSVDATTVLRGKQGGLGVMLDTGSSKELDGVAGHLSWATLDIDTSGDRPRLKLDIFGD